MNFFIITIVSTVITFAWTFATQKHWKKKNKYANIKKCHIHDSLFGVALILIGFFINPFYCTFMCAIGFGIFLSHGFEEMYFNHEKTTKAFFIFVTKEG